MFLPRTAVPRIIPHAIPRTLAAVLATGLMLSVSSGVPALAQDNPGQQDTDQAQGTVITTGDLGLGESTTFLGRTTKVPFSIMVPPGTTPEALTGTFQLPADFNGGVIELYSGERLLTSLPLEVQDNLAAVEIPLDGVPVEEGRADFTLRAVMDVVGDQWCREIPELTFLDGAVRYSGQSIKPTVVADFLPPVLRTLSLYIPVQPSEAVQQATLEVATSLASVYRASGVEVRVVGLPEGSAQPNTPARSGERQIVLTDTGVAGLELINPGEENVYLQINGRDEQVADQARLLTDSLLPLAADQQVTGAGFGAVPGVSADMATLTELGNYNLSSESVGVTAVRVGIERSRFRPIVESVDIHLTGSYTPLPDSNNGQISVRVGDTVLDYFTVDDSGEIDRKFTLPGELADRYTELVVEYRTTGVLTCGDTQPVGLTINGDSLITTQHTDVPVLSGFRTLPQAFQPTVDVAMTQGDVSDVSRAVSLLTGVQSLSTTRVRPQVVTWEEAATSTRPTVFIDAEGERARELPRYLSEAGTTLTVATRDGSGVAADEPTQEEKDLARQLTTTANLSAGGLEVVWDAEAGRMIMVASSNRNSRQLDGVIRWLDEDNTRWAGLNGDVLIQVVDRTPVELEVADRPATSNTATTWVAVAVAAVVIAVVVAVTLLVSQRSRRSQRSRQSQRGQGSIGSRRAGRPGRG